MSIPSLPLEAIIKTAEKYPKPSSDYSYGTAGFRVKANLLPCALFRTAIIAVLRSQKLGGKTIGVMITASHNPAPDNGVKLIDPRGEMLESAWEAYATTICNASSPEHLVKSLESLIKTLKIDLSVKPSVVFGRDTRPSGKELAQALCDGFEAMGISKEEIGFEQDESEASADKGIITTPILHHIVRSMNTRGKGGHEEYGVPSVKGYYQKLAEAFKKLTDNKKALPYPLVVDCANGVGAPCLTAFIATLGALTSTPAVTLRPISTNIDDASLLNHASGADYVKTNQKLPPVLLVPSGEALERGRLACSFDGDADRIVFYYLDDETGAFKLLDGDKQAGLAAGFLVDLVEQAGLKREAKDGDDEDEDEKGPKEGGVNVGVVQTAYANGSSTKYLSERLPVACVPTGVKHLHHAAERYDIGVYFEANGHGTVLFSPSFLHLLSTYRPRTPAQATALSHLQNLSLLINQTVGDSLSDLLLACTILIHRGWGPREWDASYLDLPNRLVKVSVPDRNAFTTKDAERRLVTPAGVQAKIDQEVRKYEGGRAFVRPSGTEDCVRVYAEAVSRTHVEELASRVSQIVEESAGL
ncbi:Phosphoglucomutase/phosphomannomutase [Phaffia rhodozyma]|uniref:Phosphoacetylglucosamine mutase n=1 Tax=Phaffia rhodozyma TaxID=264483 RepID=A0A0F7SHR8_PHARH|nr:Phosphoglucomutase/phosphomannomutase [Phaffia rhodozyma]